MSVQARHFYEFGPFRLHPAERMLLRGSEIVPLAPRLFDVLSVLVENNGHLLAREELLTAIWGDSLVEEANLTVCISALRKTLGEQSNGHKYIETVPKRGYRFVAEVMVRGAAHEGVILHEQTGAEVIFECEEETNVDVEVTAETGVNAKAHPKSYADGRGRLQSFVGGVAIIVMITGAVYWWKTVKTGQAETNAQIRSIAVLPFHQLGEGERDELAGFGMADVLITNIGSFNRIEMRPTSAVFKYMGTEPDIMAVGRELKVEALIEGNIQRIGGRIRVTARLVRARDGKLLWAETFDGRPDRPFELQDRMSQRLAAELFLRPADDQKRLLTKRNTDIPEAYQAYLKGRYFWNNRSTDGLKKAVEYFEQAIEKDPSFARAFAGLADSYSLLVNYTQISPKEGFPKAKEAATNALRIDDTLAEAHASLAKIYHLYEWDWEAAESEFKRAIELDPDYATAHQWYGEYLTSMGRFDEAKAEMKRALEFDPVSMAINVAQGFPYYHNREYDEAIASYKKALELNPDFEFTHWRLHNAYVQKQMYKEAIAEYVASYKSYPETQERIKAIYAALGIRGFWKLSVGTSQEQLEKCCSNYIARIYAHLGDRELALKWLEKAYQARAHMMVDVKVDPDWDGLRSDPRFADLLQRMRLQP